MTLIPLGRTSQTVDPLMLGTMTFGTQTPEADAHAQMDMAVEHGLRWLDTAHAYPVNPMTKETMGITEDIIGRWIAKRGKGALKLATKIAGEGGMAPAITGAGIRAAIDASLRRLQSDHIDLFQLHWPNRGSYHFRQNWTYRPKGDRSEIRANMTDCLQALAEAQAAGKIGAWGTSNESAWGMAQWITLAEAGAGPRPSAIQNEYSLMARLYDTDLAELAHHEDITLLAFSPLAAGLLTGKYQNAQVPEGSRMSLNGNLGGRWQPRVPATVAAYLAVADKHGLDPVHMALAWCQTRPFPVTAIFGATTTAQLSTILAGKDLTLTDEAIADLEATHRAHPMPY